MSYLDIYAYKINPDTVSIIIELAVATVQKNCIKVRMQMFIIIIIALTGLCAP